MEARNNKKETGQDLGTGEVLEVKKGNHTDGSVFQPDEEDRKKNQL